MSKAPKGYYGQNGPNTDTSRFNATDFHIEQAKKLMNVATLVQVMKVTTTGAAAAVGFVDVQPLVNLVDGRGNATQHGVVHNIPYFRLLGGADKAIIMDPKVGDVGLCVFADRDISAVKKNKKASPPGSRRRNNMADGLFIGGFLGGVPKCYIRFTDDNKIIGHCENDFEFVLADSHAQIKKKGSSNLHFTVMTDKLMYGEVPTIGPDPFPGD